MDVPLRARRETQAAASTAEPSRTQTQAMEPLESILRTEQLRERPQRSPDYETENQALASLVQALADSPRTILQTLADKVVEVLRAGSAGLSLLTKDGKRFYWTAIAGLWSPHLGGGTPRDFGPCGDVLDRNVPLLFTHWEHRYPYLDAATPLAEEGLLVPFHRRRQGGGYDLGDLSRSTSRVRRGGSAAARESWAIRVRGLSGHRILGCDRSGPYRPGASNRFGDGCDYHLRFYAPNRAVQ